MHYIKVFFKICLALFLCFLLVWIIIVGLFQTKVGKSWVVEKSSGFLEHYTQYKIEFENIDFIFPLGIRIDHLKVSDQKELLVTIDEVRGFCLSPRLFQGKIVCSNLSARGIKIFSTGQAKSNKELSASTFSLPYYLKLENIDLQDIQFMPNFIESFQLDPQICQQLKFCSFDLKGMLGRNPWRSSFYTDLTLTAHDLNHVLSPVILKIKKEKSYLSFSLQSERLPIPQTLFTTDFSINATASVESWFNLIQGKTTKIEGQLAVSIPEKDLKVKSHYQVFSKKDFRLFAFQLDEPHVQLTGEAKLTDQEILESSFKGHIHVLDNTLAVQVKALGLFKDLLLQLDLSAPRLKWQKQDFDNFHLMLQTNLAINQAKGLIDANFEIEQLPYHLITDFNWKQASQSVHFQDIVMHAVGSRLIGELEVNTSNYLIDGFIKANETEIKPIAQLADLDISGYADLLINLMPITENELTRQGLEYHVKAHDIKSKELSIEQLILNSSLNTETFELVSTGDLSKLKFADFFIEKGSAKIKCKDILKDLQGICDFTLEDLGTSQAKIDTLNGQSQFKMSETQWPFDLLAKGNLKENWEVRATGFWHTDLKTTHLDLEKLNGYFGQTNLQLLAPVSSIKTAEALVIDPFHIQWGESQISGFFSKESNQFKFDFKASEIPSEIVNLAAAKLPFTTNAALDIHLEGDINTPQGFITIDFKNLKFNEDYLIKKALLRGNINLEFPGNGIEINSQIYGIGHSPLSIKGLLPYNINLSPLELNEKNAPPLDISIEGEGDIDSYLPLFIEDYPSLSGQIKMALQLSGSVANPAVNGHLDLREGIYENQETGAIYDHITARLEGEGNKIVLRNLTTNDNHGGKLQIDGLIHLDYYNNFPFEFHINTSRIYLMHSDYASISASGPLSLSGNILKSKLKGLLQADQSIVKLEEALPKQIKTVDVNYINIPKGFIPFTDKSSKASIELDLKLNAPDVVIQGNGLKSTWKGEIGINGTTKQPLLYGDLHISKGLYEIKGKTFNLSQGSIHFAGAAEKKTTLYVVASKEIDSLKVEIIVKGPLNKLSLSFRSNPPLSQREILSFILFNKGISDITTGEGDTLNQSFITLNSTEQTEEKQDLLTRLRNNMGIDRLDFTTSGEGENKDFALQVGKYLWEGVFVSLNKSIGAAPDRVAVEVKLKKNFKAEAEVDIGSSSQGKVSLKWKRDY